MPSLPRGRRAVAAVAGVIALAGALLALPAPAPEVDRPSESRPFRWDADALFAELEAEFVRASAGGAAGSADPRAESGAAADAPAAAPFPAGARGAADSGAAPGADASTPERLPDAARAVADSLLGEADALLRVLATEPGGPPLEALARLSTVQMRLAVQGAAHPALLPEVEDLLRRVRIAVVSAAAAWRIDRDAHEALYRILYGGRIALDEALVQAGADALPRIVHLEDVASTTPSIVVEGVRIHSGDLLLSRGGAPTSALIARGNDFPNVFSHVALAHVDAETGQGTVVESLIEAGSVTSTPEAYLASKKHRILVLRLRPDHPALAADPLLPHRAAEAMLERVRSGHIPYDFAMAWQDPAEAFCSEIVYHAYRNQGVELWPVRAAMSAPGLTRWLAAMGVREFASLVPSDAEMDPQLRAVVEWRDADALLDFRVDNAVLDALLEEADRGADLGYAWYTLPAARLLKGYSVVRAALGGVPRIPTGMSAATALRVDALVSTVHPALADDVWARAADFRSRHGYEPPYWTLVGLAREAVAEVGPSLAPALRR